MKNMSFRCRVNLLLKYVRYLQGVGLLSMMGTFFFCPILPWIRLVTGLGFVLMLSAYLIIKREVICPKCGKNLSYLIFEQNLKNCQLYGVIFAPKQFAKNLHCCPYCGNPFDMEIRGGGSK